jgi:hypothetical protein
VRETPQPTEEAQSEVRAWIRKHKSPRRSEPQDGGAAERDAFGPDRASSAETGETGSTAQQFGPDEGLPRHLDRIIEQEHTEERRPLSVDGAELRPECIRGRSGRAVEWDTAATMWRSWLDGYRDGALVLEGPDGDQHEKPAEVRFGEHRSAKEYARLHNLHEGIEQEWDNVHVAFITLTASNRNDRGGYRCPADHIAELTETHDDVMKVLRRQIDDSRNWTYVWAMEPHKSGYAHRHLAVFVEGNVPRGVFEPVLDAHVEKCQAAGRAAHRPGEALEMKALDRQKEDAINSVAYYLAEYIADGFQAPTEAPDHVQRFNALLWATESRRVGYAQSAVDLRKKGYEAHTGDDYPEAPEDSDWSLVGFRDSDGDLVEIDQEEDGDFGTLLIQSRRYAPDVVDPPPDDS